MSKVKAGIKSVSQSMYNKIVGGEEKNSSINFEDLEDCYSPLESKMSKMN